MLDVEKIRQLIEMMVSNDLVELSLRDGDIEVNLRRPTARESEAVATAGSGCQTVIEPTTTTSLAESEGSEAEDDSERVEIKAPMVGTFYAAPDPDSAPFVHTGTPVEPSTVVCLLEAMKVFSEIKADVTGIIESGEESQRAAVETKSSSQVPPSVDLVAFGGGQSITDSWWWVSWPWLMVLLSAIFLAGFIWIKRRKRKTVKA